ncbi:MAG: hypothetical protein BGN87_06435 [Rhizobiales bacterium 65-79]|jgi:hypothetical protein|nr:hypothetical protein [Hyphomicrobiales bacterium]OJU02827.1 MAG: hypothetical protein BGN87_06435 [Rhizobiales bacterium 65-79]
MSERALSRSIAQMASLLEPFATGRRPADPEIFAAFGRCLVQLEIMARILELRAARQQPDPEALAAAANIIRFPAKGERHGRRHS